MGIRFPAGITDYDLALADAVVEEFLTDIFDDFVTRYWIDRSNLIAHDEGVSDGFRADLLGIRRDCPFTDETRKRVYQDGFAHGAVLGK